MLRIFLILAFALQPLASFGGATCAQRSERSHSTLPSTTPAAPKTSSCCAAEPASITPEPMGCCMMTPASNATRSGCGCEMSGTPAQNGKPVSEGFPVERSRDYRSIEILTLLQRAPSFHDLDLQADAQRRNGFSDFDSQRRAALTNRQAHALLCVWQT